MLTLPRPPSLRAVEAQERRLGESSPVKSNWEIKSELQDSPVFRVDGSEDNGCPAVGELFCGIGERDDL